MDADTQAEISQLNAQIRELKKKKSALKWGATPNKTNDKNFDRYSKMIRYIKQYGKDEEGNKKPKGKRDTITMEMWDYLKKSNHFYDFKFKDTDAEKEDQARFQNWKEATGAVSDFQTMRDWAQQHSNEVKRPVEFKYTLRCEFDFDFKYCPQEDEEEMLECPICYSEKLETNFVAVKCGGNHKICKTCIKKHKDTMRRNNRDMKCPMCNHNFGTNPQDKDCWNNITISDRYRNGNGVSPQVHIDDDDDDFE